MALLALVTVPCVIATSPTLVVVVAVVTKEPDTLARPVRSASVVKVKEGLESP